MKETKYFFLHTQLLQLSMNGANHISMSSTKCDRKIPRSNNRVHLHLHSIAQFLPMANSLPMVQILSIFPHIIWSIRRCSSYLKVFRSKNENTIVRRNSFSFQMVNSLVSYDSVQVFQYSKQRILFHSSQFTIRCTKLHCTRSVSFIPDILM